MEVCRMIGAKYIESLESGVIGALLIPTGMILLYAAAAIIDQLIGASAHRRARARSYSGYGRWLSCRSPWRWWVYFLSSGI